MRALVEVLRNESDASTIRTKFLSSFALAAGADAGLSFGLQRDGHGRPRLVSVTTWGDEELTLHLDALDGVLLRTLVEDAPTLLDLPLRAGRLGVFDVEAVPEHCRTHIWSPGGFSSSLSMNVVERGVFLAHVSLYRRRDGVPFGDEDLRSLRPWQTTTEAAVRLAAATERARSASAPGAYVWGTDGRLHLVGVEADRSLAPVGLRREVEHFVQSGDESLDTVAAGALLRLVRLHGEEELVLAFMEPLSPYRLPALLELPPAMRQVAAMAARGLTNDDIAAAIGRSPNTVRSHLKKLFDVLGVRSRAELVRLVYASNGL